MCRLDDYSVCSRLRNIKSEFQSLLQRARLEEGLKKDLDSKFEDLMAQSKILEKFLLIKQNQDVKSNTKTQEPTGLRERRRAQKLKKLSVSEGMSAIFVHNSF